MANVLVIGASGQIGKQATVKLFWTREGLKKFNPATG